MNNEIEQLVQRRLATAGPQEDKLAPFRQQAAVIRRNKDASAERVDELAATLRNNEAALADLQSQVGCHKAVTGRYSNLTPTTRINAYLCC